MWFVNLASTKNSKLNQQNNSLLKSTVQQNRVGSRPMLNTILVVFAWDSALPF